MNYECPRSGPDVRVSSNRSHSTKEALRPLAVAQTHFTHDVRKRQFFSRSVDTRAGSSQLVLVVDRQRRSRTFLLIVSHNAFGVKKVNECLKNIFHTGSLDRFCLRSGSPPHGTS
jgi:hypothetical protein